MQLTDPSFLFFIMPLLLVVSFAGFGVRMAVLIPVSLFFYACGSPEYFVLFIAAVIANTALAYLISALRKSEETKPFSLCALALGIAANLGILFYYKYVDFFMMNMNTVFGTSFRARELLLPLGISFMTFKAISLLVDVYKGTVELSRNPAYPILYFSFFGQIISGPIARYNEFYQERLSDDHSEAGISGTLKRLADGGYLFLRGFCKKTLIANLLLPLADEVFSLPKGDGGASIFWLGSIAFSLQLYYDFSGYSDMAIGIGRMFGIHCEDNFNYPYASKSVSEFWRRWHISLGRWFKDYVYLPLGGSRVSQARLFLNLFTVWLLTGLWHGDNWTFIVWGLVNFCGVYLEKLLRRKGEHKSSVIEILSRVPVLVFFNLQWVIFNSKDLASAITFILRMFGIGKGGFADARASVLLGEYWPVLLAAAILAFPVIPKIKEKLDKRNDGVSSVIYAALGFALCAASVLGFAILVSGENNPFLYGNF